MQYIKFYMRNNLEIEVSIEEAERILRHPGPLVKIREKGKWEGATINKKFIICTTKISRPDSLQPLKENLPNKKGQIKVPGGWQKINVREKIVKLWNKLKNRGCFQGINSYEEWEKLTYNS